MSGPPAGILLPMHPIETVHTWITGHPVSFSLLLTFGVGLPSSVYSAEIKEFLKLPPQRLKIRVLKARVSAAEFRLYRVELLRVDIRLFIYEALRTVVVPVLLIGVSILLNTTTLMSLHHSIQTERGLNVPWQAMGSLSAIVSYFGVYVGLSGMLLLRDAAHGETSVARLEAKKEILKRKLELHSKVT